MRKVIGLLLIIGAVWGIRQLIAHYERVEAEKIAREGGGPSPARVDTSVLPGLPSGLEASLQTAQKQGAAGMRNWLKAYRPYVTDPRLAAIELDYIVLVGANNIKEARQVFAAVKQRTSTNSPVYPRIKQLEKTYRWTPAL
jgi:hypothetical protein